jgi:membrane protein
MATWSMRPPTTRALAEAALAVLIAVTAYQVGTKQNAKPGLTGGHSQDASLADLPPDHGRHASTPREIPWRGWRDILVRTWKEVQDDSVPLIAAGVTFYVLLALFPAIVAFVSIYGLFSSVGEVPKHLATLNAVLPASALSFLAEQMTRVAAARPAGLSWALVISLLLSLWSANGAAKAMFLGLNIAYEEREKRGFFLLNLASLAFTLGLLVIAIALAALLVAVPAGDAAGVLPGAIGYLHWPAFALLALIGLAILYRFGPSRAHARWRWVSWGSAAATLAWLAASAVFSVYVSEIVHLEQAYGQLATGIGFLIWTYWSVLIVLVGAELNAEIEHQTVVDSTTGEPAPMGARGAKMADTIGKTV